MTWWDRIARARAAGGFCAEDTAAWVQPATCLVGETVGRVFGDQDAVAWARVNWVDWPLTDTGAGMNAGLLHALLANDYAFVERRLGEIEDRALAVKREALA